MNLLIFGASGRTGHHLVNQALEGGNTVTALVRDPSKLKISHDQLRVVRGELSDDSILTDLLKGQHAVISALGASSPFKYDQTVVDGMRMIVKAMERGGVARLIYLSFIGVRESRADGGIVIKYLAPVLLKTEIAGHEEREKIIRGSKLDWTIVRAPTLTNGIKKGDYRTGVALSSGGFVVSIPRADVADFMLTQCDNNSNIGKVIRIM
jgi:putative NADH-flavin reductase